MTASLKVSTSVIVRIFFTRYCIPSSRRNLPLGNSVKECRVGKVGIIIFHLRSVTGDVVTFVPFFVNAEVPEDGSVRVFICFKPYTHNNEKNARRVKLTSLKKQQTNHKENKS